MGSKRHMGERIGWSRRGFPIQKNCGARWITLNRECRDFLTLLEFQMDFGSHPPADFDILLDRLIIIQGGAKLMGSKRHMLERVGWSLRGLAVQKNSSTGWITLN